MNESERGGSIRGQPSNPSEIRLGVRQGMEKKIEGIDI